MSQAEFEDPILAYAQRFITACADDFLIEHSELGTIRDKGVVAQIEKEAVEREQNEKK